MKRFSGLARTQKTAEAVERTIGDSCTPLKRGVNEKRATVARWPSGAKTPFVRLVLAVFLGWLALSQALAQTFTTLHSFTAVTGALATNSDGAIPQMGLIVSGNTLYGSAVRAGSLGNGTVFAVNTDGTGFTPLHDFSGGTDGAEPEADLILSSNTLYGTAYNGGSLGNGTVFAINSDGTGFRSIYAFSAGSDGANPSGSLTLAAGTLYGTAHLGGSGSNGTVFAVNVDGTGFRVLHEFTAFSDANARTNEDGALPFSGLILASNTLYGTTVVGGSWGDGTVFAVNTDGSDFRSLHAFTPTVLTAPGHLSATNSDGGHPLGGLVLYGNTLYGAASTGGSSGWGTIYAINTDGSSFTNLHNFAGDPVSGINSDGEGPAAALVLMGNTLYGTAVNGGSSGNGTIFSLNTDGTSFRMIHSFSAISCCPLMNHDGSLPDAGLILSGATLYGTASHGGNWNNGAIFSIELPPQLTISGSGRDLTLAWPTNFTGFILQATTNLASPAAWTLASSAPAIINGQNAVTNAATGTQQFFRLVQ